MDITEAAALMSARESEVAVVEPHDNGTVIEMVDGTAYIDVADETPDADGKTGLMYLRTPAVKGFIPVFPVFAYETESAVEPVPASETAPADPNGSPPAGETAPATSDADAAPAARKGK